MPREIFSASAVNQRRQFMKMDRHHSFRDASEMENSVALTRAIPRPRSLCDNKLLSVHQVNGHVTDRPPVPPHRNGQPPQRPPPAPLSPCNALARRRLNWPNQTARAVLARLAQQTLGYGHSHTARESKQTIPTQAGGAAGKPALYGTVAPPPSSPTSLSTPSAPSPLSERD